MGGLENIHKNILEYVVDSFDSSTVPDPALWVNAKKTFLCYGPQSLKVEYFSEFEVLFETALGIDQGITWGALLCGRYLVDGSVSFIS
jgi:hypothetical protein